MNFLALIKKLSLFTEKLTVKQVSKIIVVTPNLKTIFHKKYNVPLDYVNENPEVSPGSSKPFANVYLDDRAVRFENQNANDLEKLILEKYK